MRENLLQSETKRSVEYIAANRTVAGFDYLRQGHQVYIKPTPKRRSHQRRLFPA